MLGLAVGITVVLTTFLLMAALFGYTAACFKTLTVLTAGEFIEFLREELIRKDGTI
jgi:hypothetical protein